MTITTQKTTMQIKKIFWAWEDEKEEAWLREQSNRGYHLVKVEWGLYTFETGEPLDVIYRMDYIQTTDPKQIETYLQLFQDAGWEQVGELLGWRYFSKPYQPGQQDEIYSDSESKIEKYKRLLYLVLCTLMVSILPILNMRLFTQSPAGRVAGWVFAGFLSVCFLIELYFTVRILQRIRQLKRM